MQPSLFFLIVASVLGIASTALADGGLVRAQQRVGDHLLTLFTSPTPLRAGPVDISVLVQHADTGVALPEQPVLIRARTRDEKHSIVAEATKASATNKLMQAAKLVLPESGDWTLRATGMIDDAPFEIECVATVAPPLPKCFSCWRLLLLPPTAIGLFIAHRLLVIRAPRKR